MGAEGSFAAHFTRARVEAEKPVAGEQRGLHLKFAGAYALCRGSWLRNRDQYYPSSHQHKRFGPKRPRTC